MGRAAKGPQGMGEEGTGRALAKARFVGALVVIAFAIVAYTQGYDTVFWTLSYVVVAVTSAGWIVLGAGALLFSVGTCTGTLPLFFFVYLGLTFVSRDLAHRRSARPTPASPDQ